MLKWDKADISQREVHPILKLEAFEFPRVAKSIPPPPLPRGIRLSTQNEIHFLFYLRVSDFTRSEVYISHTLFLSRRVKKYVPYV